ncbi:MAG: tetratricopeptide (TPR) repeat protein, partial [Limisphaerales bacterium]
MISTINNQLYRKRQMWFSLCFIFSIGLIPNSYGQSNQNSVIKKEEAAKSNKRERADRYFDALAFKPAIKLYKQLEEDSNDPDVRLKLADCYRLINDYTNAEFWYEQIVLQENIDPLNKFYYAQALMANEKYDRARIWFEEYARARPDDPRGRNLADACTRVPEIIANSYPCELTNADFNTARSEFGPSFYGGDGVLFTSDRDTILGIKRTNEWYNTPFLNLYVEKGNGKVKKLKGNLNARYHEGPAVVTRDGSTMYFTRSNYTSGGLSANQSESQEGLVKLKIFKAISSGNDKWSYSAETALPFNSDEYSVGHPSLSEDGQTLYFISDMPGGYGGTDIYMASLKADGLSWSDAKNLGPVINTPGNELFPFIHPDETFFFASDGLPGLGGLDIFETRRAENGSWVLPSNMGSPINSSRDDFGLIFNDNLNSG